MELSRRSFLAGAAVLTAGAAAPLFGCSTKSEKQPESAATEEKIEPKETIECEICIAGAGIAGLAACVQAASDGADVVVLEAAGEPGGNGSGIGGIFGANSELQKAQGIEIDKAALVANELNSTQYRVDGRMWSTLYDNSAKNIAWLIEQGMQLSGVVDDYGTGGFKSMHYFEGRGGNGYVKPMAAKAEELGVRFIYNTAAKKPIMDGEKVVGVYAQNNQKEWVEVKAKAVILATGGFGGDSELVSRIGYKPENIWYYGVPTNIGDGYRIAMEAGAEDFTHNSADNAHAYIRALPHEGPTDMPNCMMSMAGFPIWVNEKGKRFVREDCGVRNFELQNPPRWNQESWYFVFNEAIYDAVCDLVNVDHESGHQILKSSVETNEGDCLYTANTLEELAGKFDLDPKTFAEEMKKYDQYCASGVDEDWSKDPMWMIPLGDGPYYITKPETLFLMSIGAIVTNENGQAINNAGAPIEGLYAIGVDGCMLYRNVYTIDAPASCCGNSVNMGRTAARHACGLGPVS